MEKKDADLLHEDLNAINATLKQLKDGLYSVRTEVQTIHKLVDDLPTGEKWVPTGAAKASR
jgi:hypothetical protein